MIRYKIMGVMRKGPPHCVATETDPAKASADVANMRNTAAYRDAWIETIEDQDTPEEAEVRQQIMRDQHA